MRKARKPYTTTTPASRNSILTLLCLGCGDPAGQTCSQAIVEPGPLADDFHLLADQAVRSPSGVELPRPTAFGAEDEAKASLFEAAAQMQVGAHWQAGPFQ